MRVSLVVDVPCSDKIAAAVITSVALLLRIVC